MSSTMAVDREGGPLPKVALAAGVLAALAFFGLGFILEGWWFVLALVLGAVAVLTGWMGRQQSSGSDRTLATIGLVLGAIVVVWFATYMIVSTIF